MCSEAASLGCRPRVAPPQRRAFQKQPGCACDRPPARRWAGPPGRLAQWRGPPTARTCFPALAPGSLPHLLSCELSSSTRNCGVAGGPRTHLPGTRSGGCIRLARPGGTPPDKPALGARGQGPLLPSVPRRWIPAGMTSGACPSGRLLTSAGGCSQGLLGGGPSPLTGGRWREASLP